MHARRRRGMTRWCWRESKAPNRGGKTPKSTGLGTRTSPPLGVHAHSLIISHQRLVVLDALKVHPLIHRGSCRLLMWERVLNNINLLKWDLVSEHGGTLRLIGRLLDGLISA